MSSNHERVTVYLPRELHARLKSKLALQGSSVSAWVRKQAERELRPRRK